jgi:ABC-type multidrug transport system fused ATPase/permease subunit
MDVLIFGSILYGMVGLHPDFGYYVIFIAILFTFSLLMNQMMAVFAAMSPTKATVQILCSCLLLFAILFGGFIVPPNVIPNYYIWIYWWNPMAWAYRALLVLEFQSPSYDDGDAILSEVGFLFHRKEPFQREWVGYSFAYMIPHFLLCVLATAFCLTYVTTNPGKGSLKTSTSLQEEESTSQKEEIEIPFVPATLTFEDICYDVQTSTGKDKLRLLNNVSGVFGAGRMCALMGTSGAGKVGNADILFLDVPYFSVYPFLLFCPHLLVAFIFQRQH